MEKREKLYQKLRQYEREVLTATPTRAAKLTVKITKWKGEIFDS
jgi:hypothetical protein